MYPSAIEQTEAENKRLSSLVDEMRQDLRRLRRERAYFDADGIVLRAQVRRLRYQRDSLALAFCVVLLFLVGGIGR